MTVSTLHRSPSIRWLGLLLLSIALHGLFIAQAGKRWGEDKKHADNQPLQIVMVKLPPPPAVVSTDPVTPPHRQPNPVVEPAQIDPPAPPPTALAPPSVGLNREENMDIPNVSNDIPPPPPPAETGRSSEPAGYVEPPASASIEFLAVLEAPGFSPARTNASLKWENQSGHYALQFETDPPFFLKVLKLRWESKGLTQGLGIQPERFVEQRRDRAEVATNFQWSSTDPQQNTPTSRLSFSRTTDTFPLQAGTQDQLSVLIQLGVLLQTYSRELLYSGASFEVPVAGTRTLSNYVFTVVGEETLEIPFGKLATVHVRSQPLANKYALQIEAWLAKEHEYLPVRLRFTSGENYAIDAQAKTITR